MSILIKGMEMPTEQYGKMVITLYPNGHVAEYIGDIGRVWEAVPVPAHGRLIDGDAFEEFIRKDWDKADHWIAEVVYSRPTIIEAEETLKEATNDQNNS